MGSKGRGEALQSAIVRLLPAILRLPSPENARPWDIAVRGRFPEVLRVSERDRVGSRPDDLCVPGLGMMAEAIVKDD